MRQYVHMKELMDFSIIKGVETLCGCGKYKPIELGLLL